MNRRGLLGWLAGLLGVGVTTKIASAKVISADPSTLCVIEMDASVDMSEEALAHFRSEWEKAKTGFRCVVLSPGLSIKALPSGGVYYRERLGEYEIEIVAKSEADLTARLAELHAK